MEQEHIIDWVEKEVIKSITPQQVRMPPPCTILKSLPGSEATVANCQILLFVLFCLRGSSSKDKGLPQQLKCRIIPRGTSIDQFLDVGNWL